MAKKETTTKRTKKSDQPTDDTSFVLDEVRTDLAETKDVMKDISKEMISQYTGKIAELETEKQKLTGELSMVRQHLASKTQSLESEVERLKKQIEEATAHSEKQNMVINKCLETLNYVQNRNNGQSFIAVPRDIITRCANNIGFVQKIFPPA